MIEKGKRYRVVRDSDYFFKEGEIVVSLEDNIIPWCVRESEYCEGKKIFDYKISNCNVLHYHELEKIDGEEYAEDDSEDNLTADIIKHKDELLKYREIGTLDECRAAVEKQKAMKPKNMEYKRSVDAGWHYACPLCECAVGENEYASEVTDKDNYCGQCGQKLDWD